MKMSGKILAFLLAISFVFSSVAFVSAASDDAIESPIIPVGPQTSEWYRYDYNTILKTAVLIGFNPAAGRTNVTVPSTVTKSGETYAVVGVGAEAFKGTDIKSAKISEGVEFVERGAFANCAQLTSVTFPDSLTFVDETAFDGTAWLAAQPDGVIYAGKVAFKAKGVSPASVFLASDTVAIADGAFRGQTTLEKVYIPDIATIGTDAFAGCANVVLFCYENSPAHLYAIENEIPYSIIPVLVLKSEPIRRMYFCNEALDFEGIVLVYITEAGEITVPVEEEMISGYDATVIGTQTVTITYEGLSVSFTVEVFPDNGYFPGDLDANAVLNTDDAIYLLYHLNFADLYSANQDVDFDGSGTFDLDDVIYLLYHVAFADLYPLH